MFYVVDPMLGEISLLANCSWGNCENKLTAEQFGLAVPVSKTAALLFVGCLISRKGFESPVAVHKVQLPAEMGDWLTSMLLMRLGKDLYVKGVFFSTLISRSSSWR